MKTVSIIIPVYNTSSYLKQCLESVIFQSFQDWECILVDDGSTDMSGAICDEYANHDHRVKVIHQENKGVSAARNKGMALANGKYLTFMDSDDWIDKDYLSKLIMHVNNADFVISGLVKIQDNEVLERTMLDEKKWDLEEELQFCGFLLNSYLTSSWSKLYSNEIIKNNKLSFISGLAYGEDRDFNIEYLKYVNTAVSTSYAGYYYRKGIKNSLSEKVSGVFWVDNMYWTKLRDLCRTKGFYGESTNRILTNRLFHIVNDRISKICNEQTMVWNAVMKCKKELTPVDFTFLKTNRKLINAPYWLRFLVIHKLFFFMYFTYVVSNFKNKHGN